MNKQENITKKSYKSPKLFTYGTFNQLTQGTPAPTTKDNKGKDASKSGA